MGRKKEKTYEEDLNEFVNQMRNAGVTDKTIKQCLKEINDYQEKQMKEKLCEAFTRFQKIAKEALKRDYENLEQNE